MDKAAYTRLVQAWGRNRRLHVRSKIVTLVCSLVVVALAGYLSLLAGSRTLFAVLLLVIFLRTFYLLAKGDWHDLSSQIGLKCWECGHVYCSDKVLEDVLQHNRCPHCRKPVYDLPEDVGRSGK